MTNEFRPIPGTQKPRRIVPRFHWELLVCGVSGHELAGTDAAALRAEDVVFARDLGGVRWFRCLRCDSWLPLAPPEEPAREHPPELREIELPLRGKALRDKVVLRLIAIDRAFHFLLLGAFAVLVLVFASHESQLRRLFFRVLGDVEGGPRHGTHGLLHTVQRLVTIQSGTLYVVAALAAAYALLEGVEAVGLWIGARWAEYLTFVATTLLLPVEVYELVDRRSVFKIIAFVVNLAVVVYLLFAKRLFGLRGGAEADRRERERDLGWDALRATAPPSDPPATMGVARV